MTDIQMFRNENDPYIDFEFFLDGQDGLDWKAVVFFDTEDNSWNTPEYSVSPSADTSAPFEETELAPPPALETFIRQYINENQRPKLTGKSPYKKRRLDNEEFMLELMRFSRYGALAQGFIFQAIHQYAKQVAEADPKMFEPEKSEAVVLSIHGPAWQGVAKELFQKLEERFNE